MGFRHKIGILDKNTHKVIKDMSAKELRKWYGEHYVPCYKITKEVFELGKYYDDKFLKPYRTKVFSNKRVHRSYQQDNLFYIISQKGFEAIIDDHRQRVLEYYQSVLKQDKSDYGVPTLEQAIESKIRTWGENCTKFKIYPYSLEGEQITDSWEFEYAIFELVRIYKSVNWDKEYVTITGW